MLAIQMGEVSVEDWAHVREGFGVPGEAGEVGDDEED